MAVVPSLSAQSVTTPEKSQSPSFYYIHNVEVWDIRCKPKSVNFSFVNCALSVSMQRGRQKLYLTFCYVCCRVGSGQLMLSFASILFGICESVISAKVYGTRSYNAAVSSASWSGAISVAIACLTIHSSRANTFKWVSCVDWLVYYHSWTAQN